MEQPMFDKLFNSIVFRIGSMMLAISFIAILSMFSSMFISELADKDALLINHAGSMRMQSYKILAQLELLPHMSASEQQVQQQLLKKSIKTFSSKVNNPIMMADDKPIPIISTSMALQGIKQQWESTLAPELIMLVNQPRLLSANKLSTVIVSINHFVSQVDNLVVLYQQRAEQRISLIRLILGGSLFITVLLSAYIMLQISRRVEKPLSELTGAAKKIIAGDYTATVEVSQSDELGLLAQTMNKMSQAISYSHAGMADRVREKTLKLQQSNESLALLYKTSQLINNQDTPLNLTPLSEELSTITGINNIDICLTTINGNKPYEHIFASDMPLAEQCQQLDCDQCLSKQGVDVDICDHSMIVRYPINKDSNSYGVIVCNLNAKSPLETWQHQLLSSIATLLANGFHIRQQAEQSRRIALLSERNVIARELHDSLAQALSYLKIQVSCLQKLQKKNAPTEQTDEVIGELKNGLNSAYRQLRELLTTFRLKIEADGLQQAFIETIEQLNQRASDEMNFTLDYNINNIPLTPNEEIHLMQITREASQNALNHSKGTESKVTVSTDNNKAIHLIIEDNGIGLPDDTSKLNHYGLAIMQERSQNLQGTLSLEKSAMGGTKVEVCFLPDYVKPALKTA